MATCEQDGVLNNRTLCKGAYKLGGITMQTLKKIIDRMLQHIGKQHTGVILILHITERILLCIELVERILKHLKP